MKRYVLTTMACGHEVGVLVDEDVQNVAETVYEASQRACQDCLAWEEDEKDMARIAREWAQYDRDPPGS